MLMPIGFNAPVRVYVALARECLCLLCECVGKVDDIVQLSAPYSTLSDFCRFRNIPLVT